MKSSNLISSQKVLAQLTRKYGPQQVARVECLTEGVYRATLRDGSIVAAFVTESGEVVSHRLDPVGV